VEKNWQEMKKTKAEWAAARERETRLDSQLTKLPYNSERYSLFLVETIGVEDEYTVVLPERAAQDTYRVGELVRHALEPKP
jgi:hypothetical protein